MMICSLRSDQDPSCSLRTSVLIVLEVINVVSNPCLVGVSARFVQTKFNGLTIFETMGICSIDMGSSNH